MISRILGILFPASKLSDSFPWTVQTAGKKYFVGLMHFAIGSFLAPVLFMGAILGLSNFPALQVAVQSNAGISKLLVSAGVAAALAAFLCNLLRLFLQDSGEIRRRLVQASPYYLVFGAAVACLLPWLVKAFAPHFPATLSWIFGVIAEPDGNPKMSFIMGLSLLSFVMGFGLQVRYIAGQMRKEGLSLAKAMALTLEPLKGRCWVATLFNLLVPVAIAYVLSQLIGETVVHFMGAAQQPTVELAKQATGGNFLLFALMAVIGAPIFEELVFRGFLFQVIRCSLKREISPLALTAVPAVGFRRYVSILRNTLSKASYAVGSRLHHVLGGKRAELSAIVLSSLLFSLMHMQFQPTTMVLLFLLGCVQAELYRRTGSLYSCMLLHAVNNGIDVLKLGLGQG